MSVVCGSSFFLEEHVPLLLYMSAPLGYRARGLFPLFSEAVAAPSDGAGDTDIDLYMAMPGVLDRSSVPNDDSGESDLTWCSTLTVCSCKFLFELYKNKEQQKQNY